MGTKKNPSASKLGKLSAKSRHKGKSKKEISEYYRALAKKRVVEKNTQHESN